MEEFPGQLEGSKVYHYQGYDYHRDNKRVLTTQNFKCAKRKCNGRATCPVDNPEAVKVTLHNHAKDASKFQTFKLRQALKHRAATDLSTPIMEIFNEECRIFSDAATEVCPTTERRRMRRIRRKKLPQIPDDYQKLSDDMTNDPEVREQFGLLDPLPGKEEKESVLLKKLEGPGGTTLVFGSKYLAEKCLKNSTKICIDATFKVLPGKPAGRQLLSIHACHGTNTIPVLFCLMESKRKAAYESVFNYMKTELIPVWSPDEVMCDFEKSLRVAVKSLYTRASIKGCYFHYTQAVQRKWSQHGMMKMKAEFKQECAGVKSSIMALPFAKAEDIRNIYTDITDEISLNFLPKIQPFLNYFKKTWLSEDGKYFTPEDYSVYGDANRTNNHVESFHSRLHLKKPNIWKFLSRLISIIIEARQNYGRLLNGIEITPRIPLKVLWTQERVVYAQSLLAAGKISPLQFIRWCRQVTRDTLAIVRQGRLLRRYLRAEYNNLEYDEVATSSDESVDSDYDYDFEYEDNEREKNRMETEDKELDKELEDNFNMDDTESLFGETGRNEPSESTLPSDTDSVWHIDEEEALLQIEENMIESDSDEVPIVLPPQSVVPAMRAPQSCIVCFSDVATVVALPCTHALVCLGCKPHYNLTCGRCQQPILQFLDIIPP